MKILVVAPMEAWHWQFDNFYLKILSSMGEVTFIASEGYPVSCEGVTHLYLPKNIFSSKTRLGVYFGLMKALRYVAKLVRFEDYDRVVFLAYETISFFFCGPNRPNVFIAEHNNIASIQGSWIKKMIFRWLSPKVTSLALQDHMLEYVKCHAKRKVVKIKVPCFFGEAETNPGLDEGFFSKDKKRIIFSPAHDMSATLLETLKTFVSEPNHHFYLIARGELEKTQHYELHPFFDHYDSLMKRCDLVFVGRRYNYRVSNICYEALACGKPIVILDCLFAQELKRDFPHIVFIVDHVSEVLTLDLNFQGMKQDHLNFIKLHSFDVLREDMLKVFDA